MKRTIARLLKPWSSNKFTRSFFHQLYSFSLFGLYGDEWRFEENGEVLFLNSLFKHLGHEPIVVFDVGANVGDYSLDVVKAAGERNVTIHAFEPSKKTFQLYSEKNKNSKSVFKNNFGLSDRDAELDLFIAQKSSGFASLYLDEGRKNFEEKERIVLKTVDGYCAERGIEAIDFMKIDVEGHELSVLRGASGMLGSHKIKAIQFEFGARNISSRTFFFDFYRLLNPEYNLYRIVKNGLVKVNAYDYKLEVFGRALNYVAIRKDVDWN